MGWLPNSPTSVLYMKFYWFIYVYRVSYSKPREPRTKGKIDNNSIKEEGDAGALNEFVGWRRKEHPWWMGKEGAIRRHCWTCNAAFKERFVGLLAWGINKYKISYFTYLEEGGTRCPRREFELLCVFDHMSLCAWSFYFQYVHRIITHTANHVCKTWGLSGVNISITALLGANICHYFDPCLIIKFSIKGK